MPTNKEFKRLSYTCSLITQGDSKFYSLSMPSEVLAETCFVSARDDDPQEGFQRVLDEHRAQEIADYIDKGTSSIPTAIILSAQKEAELNYSSKNRTIEFSCISKAFLIIDGQHRVFGFSLAETSVRVPVIIYNGLARKEETRLFIDINTKQRPVPTELLLDIKSLAEYENDIETICREIFDLFNTSTDSCLLGLLSSTSKTKGKITRVTFNAAIKPIYDIFGKRELSEVYQFLNLYLIVMINGMKKRGVSSITKPILFRAIMQLFPPVARLVNGEYEIENFNSVLDAFFSRLSIKKIESAKSIKAINDHFIECLNKGFVL